MLQRNSLYFMFHRIIFKVILLHNFVLPDALKSLEGFELCVFNLYYYFSTMQLKKKLVNGETNRTKAPKYMNKLSQSVLVVP